MGRLQVVKSTMSTADLLNTFQEKHGIEPDSLPREILKLLIARFEIYMTWAHRELNEFKDKLLEVRLKEIKKKQ